MRIGKAFVDRRKDEFRMMSEIAYIQSGMIAHARFGKLKNYDSYFPELIESTKENPDIALKNQLLQLAARSKKKR